MSRRLGRKLHGNKTGTLMSQQKSKKKLYQLRFWQMAKTASTATHDALPRRAAYICIGRLYALTDW